MSKKYDFSGWATKFNIQCSDGRIIMKDAFKHNDGQTVPLVWNHQHNEPENILGHAVLENRKEGVYAYCYLNDTEKAKTAKSLVEHGDLAYLSIYANQLKQNGNNVVHGLIREVSLVLAGANPGAFIENVIKHGEESEEEIIIYNDDEILLHSESGKEKTVQEVLDTLTEEQKTVVYALIGKALEDAYGEEEDDDDVKHGKIKNEDNEGGNNMKQNAFEQKNNNKNTLSHSEIQVIFNDIKRYGSLKESALAHGIDQIDYQFPDPKNITNQPIFIKRDTGWVSKLFNGFNKTPFSRIKSIFADLTEDDARAKGYIKGNFKKEQVFGLLKRTTSPTTIYKKQKIDKDDVNDITDFDVVAWIKSEMRMMLDEEIVRAALVGDGRSSASDDKINEQNIRPIWTDDDLFTIKAEVKVSSSATADQKAKAFIRAAVKARKDYKGSGEPTLYTTEDVLTDCLLMEDQVGRVIYDTVQKLATALRVKEIVTVPIMEGLTRNVNGKEHELMGIIVNPIDYNIGADKGGAVNLFEDFDIDYNAQKYLIETRCSGALVKPFSAIALELVEDDDGGEDD